MNNLEKMNEIFKDNPEMKQKITEEVKRLAESKEAGDPKEAIAKAVKAGLGIELTPEELGAMLEKPEKMDLDDLDAVAGGYGSDALFKSITGWISDIKDFINPPPPVTCEHKWVYWYSDHIYDESGHIQKVIAHYQCIKCHDTKTEAITEGLIDHP